MKRSEIISQYRTQIEAEMKNRYRDVLETRGKIQCKIYIRDDGKIRSLEQVQGDNGFLQSSTDDELHYICTVSAPGFDPWDYEDHPAPESDEIREAEEQEIIDWLVDQDYYPDEIIDRIIEDAEQEEDC